VILKARKVHRTAKGTFRIQYENNEFELKEEFRPSRLFFW
jgi:hypothetical protein